MSAVQRLLARAEIDVGAEALAAAIGVPVARLPEWTREDCMLTLAQRTAIVFAVITLAPAGSELLRSAASMRGRLAAEFAYSLGETRTTNGPPVHRFRI